MSPLGERRREPVGRHRQAMNVRLIGDRYEDAAGQIRRVPDLAGRAPQRRRQPERFDNKFGGWIRAATFKLVEMKSYVVSVTWYRSSGACYLISE